jgi:Mn-containing catalase
LKSSKGKGIPHHFFNTGLGALVTDSLGKGWNGEYVFNSGDLVLDLLHNFFLENGARMAKIRVYEMTDHPVARQMLGYLFVRGGVHALAYAKALEELTSVDVKKMLPIPAIPDSAFKEAQPYTEQGLHGKLYRFSPDDFKDIGAIWQGEHPIDGTPLEVEEELPEGGSTDYPPEERAVSAPGLNPEDLQEMAQRLMKNV